MLSKLAFYEYISMYEDKSLSCDDQYYTDIVPKQSVLCSTLDVFQNAYHDAQEIGLQMYRKDDPRTLKCGFITLGEDPIWWYTRIREIKEGFRIAKTMLPYIELDHKLDTLGDDPTKEEMNKVLLEHDKKMSLKLADGELRTEQRNDWDGNQKLFEAFKKLQGYIIVNIGFHPNIDEGGLTIDYVKSPDSKNIERLVLGHNELGMWVEYQGNKTTTHCPDPKHDDSPEIQELEKIIERQKEELSKWPRVFWKSRDSKSSTEGYKIISVEGKEGDGDHVWLDIWVEDEGEKIAAATDFGVYSSRESLERSRLNNREVKEM